MGVSRAHFLSKVLARVNKGQAEMFAAAIRSIFAQPTADTVRKAVDDVDDVADTLDRQFPNVATLLRDAREEITAFASFPHARWQDLEEVKRRTDVAGIFPDDASLLRLASCVLIEAHDEWQVGDRRYLSEASMALLKPPHPTPLEPRRPAQNEQVDMRALQTA